MIGPPTNVSHQCRPKQTHLGGCDLRRSLSVVVLVLAAWRPRNVVEHGQKVHPVAYGCLQGLQLRVLHLASQRAIQCGRLVQCSRCLMVTLGTIDELTLMSWRARRECQQ